MSNDFLIEAGTVTRESFVGWRSCTVIPGVGRIGVDAAGEVVVVPVDFGDSAGEVPIMRMDAEALLRNAHKEYLGNLDSEAARGVYLAASEGSLAMWSRIEALGWARDLDWQRIASDLARSPERKAIREFCILCRARLADMASRNAVVTGLGDDGFDDLLCHIVGLGREAYESALRDPATVLLAHANGEYGTVGGYKENFFYSFQ